MGQHSPPAARRHAISPRGLPSLSATSGRPHADGALGRHSKSPGYMPGPPWAPEIGAAKHGTTESMRGASIRSSGKRKAPAVWDRAGAPRSGLASPPAKREVRCLRRNKPISKVGHSASELMRIANRPGVPKQAPRRMAGASWGRTDADMERHRDRKSNRASLIPLPRLSEAVPSARLPIGAS